MDRLNAARVPNVSTLTLGRLEPDHVETMVARVTGGRVLPSEVMRQIVAKTDGHPLFVEELTKAVLEAGILVENGGCPCSNLHKAEKHWRFSRASRTVKA